MFTLAASAGDDSLLGALGNTVTNVTGSVGSTLGNTVNSLVGPSGAVCQLLCSVTNPQPQPQAQNPLPSLPCLNAALCAVTKPLTGTDSNKAPTSTTTTAPPPAPEHVVSPGSLAGSTGPVVAPDPPAGVTAGIGSLVQPPPSSITLPTATSGINFGKAPFLWPLFLGLDVLGAAAVVLALRKTWSRPAAD